MVFHDGCSRVPEVARWSAGTRSSSDSVGCHVLNHCQSGEASFGNDKTPWQRDMTYDYACSQEGTANARNLVGTSEHRLVAIQSPSPLKILLREFLNQISKLVKTLQIFPKVREYSLTETGC